MHIKVWVCFKHGTILARLDFRHVTALDIHIWSLLNSELFTD